MKSRDVWGVERITYRTPVIAAVVTVLCLATSGCMQKLQKQATVLSAATAPVVDLAAQSYKDANEIHDLRVDYDAVVNFDKTSPVYNPRTIKPLLSEKDMDARLAVLKALQVYVKQVQAIANGTESKGLDDASASLGSGLAGLGNTFLPPGSSSQTATITQGGTSVTETTTVAADAISPAAQNGIGVAVKALGQFLISRKVNKELPGLVAKMDPSIQTLCNFLSKDVDTLKSQEQNDFNFMINHQTQFLMDNKTMDAGARRELIMKLPEMVRKQRTADEELDALKAAALNLAKTHSDLVKDEQAKTPESFATKLGELADAGENLGKFYSSLPSK